MDDNLEYESKYIELKMIGKGAFGTATLVKNILDGSICVSKKIILNSLDEKNQKAALLEANLLRELNHPNIVAYKDSFIRENLLIIVMEYCEEGDLDFHIMLRKNKLDYFPEKLILNWFLESLLALKYIHEKKILHRDIKCSNIFLTSNNTIKLGDFGISKVSENSNEIAMTVVGTPYFMSPEIFESKPYTYKSDVWALGCVLYELCTLRHLFDAKNLVVLIYKIVKDEPDSIPTIYSLELQNLIKKLLTKEQLHRPSTKDILSESIMKRTMKEFVESNGNNVGSIVLPKKSPLTQNEINLIYEKELLKKKFNNKNEVTNNKLSKFKSNNLTKNTITVNDKTKFTIGNTINSVSYEESFNEKSIKDSKNSFFDKTIESVNESNFMSFQKTNKANETLYETAYESFPIIKNNNPKEFNLSDTKYTISAGSPHRKVLKQLAEKHREEEFQKKNSKTNEEVEYYDDFEVENEELPRLTVKAGKKELEDVINVCKNQLEVGGLNLEAIRESFSENVSNSPRKGNSGKKENYLGSIKERIEKLKFKCITELGEENFERIYNFIKLKQKEKFSEQKIFDLLIEEEGDDPAYFDISKIIYLEEKYI